MKKTEMDNGEDHVDKKRKTDADDDGPEEGTDVMLNLSLSLGPFVPTPLPDSNPQPASELVCRLQIYNSPRIFPPSPPPPTEIYLPFNPTETSNSPTPSPPPPVFPTATLNSPILHTQPCSSPPLQPPSLTQEPSGNGDDHPRPPRSRRNPSQLPRGGKSLEIVPPYPWATNRRVIVHSLQHLQSIQIHTITGDVQCKKCERKYEMGFNLQQKSFEIFKIIIENKVRMHDRAPDEWTHPTLPPCRFCQEENSAKPIISEKKRSVNWLFLLLGQMVGLCTLDQLKYFCKHTKNHRTGAKDRLLYLAYLGLCKQLDPNGPFDR